MVPQLNTDDVQAVVRLMDRATDPRPALRIPERRRLLIEGLARLIDADVWIWSMTALNHAAPGDVVTTCAIDGGWHSADEQARVYSILVSPEFNTRGLQTAFQSMLNGERITLGHGEVFPPDVHDELTALWRTTGFEYFLLALHPIDANFSSNLGLHRRAGKPNFSARERAIVQAVFQNIEWLHDYGMNEAARKGTIRLAKREREALILLLSGYSTTEIARRMKITVHTVKDYVRRVHKRFRVGSRSELQAYFFLGAENDALGALQEGDSAD